MRMLRLVLSALLITGLMGCSGGGAGGGGTGGDGAGEGGAGGGFTGGGTGGGSIDPPTAPTYQVAESDCPDGWIALTVTTDNEAEVEYLDDMPACTNSSGNSTYLKNNSDAVWILKSTSSNSGVWTSRKPTLGEVSFVGAVRDEYPGQAIFVPGAEGTVDLSPEQVEWDIHLPLSFGWQGHDLVVEKIESAGEAAAVAALKRRSPAGGALAVCTLGVTKFAKDLTQLEDADTSEVLLNALSASASARACQSEAASVRTMDEGGRTVTLADDLSRLSTQTKVLEEAHVRLDYAQRASKALNLGLKFLHR